MENIDINLYSRQLGVIDLNTMNIFSKINILILGMRGLGIEIAKNLILAGPKEVVIYDKNIIDKTDLNSNFFLEEKDIIKKLKRDEAVINKLSELNEYVKCSILESKEKFKNLEDELKFLLNKIENFSIVVVSEFLPRNIFEQISKKCRDNKKAIIYGCVLGVSGFIFEDFGKHIITNPFGNEPKFYPINNITKGKKTLISIDINIEGAPNLELDSLVKLSKIQGMNELNSDKPYKVKSISPSQFEIDIDSTNFNDYLYGGFIEEIISPISINNKQFNEILLNPMIGKERRLFDSSFIGRKDIVHSIILALYDKKIKLKKCDKILGQILPELNDQKFAKDLIKIAQEYFINAKKKNENWINIVDEYAEKIQLENFDVKKAYHISLWLKAEIPPIVSVLGSIIAQEVIKYSGKFSPFDQWSWFEFEYLVNYLDDKKIDRRPMNCRYDEQIAIFGREIQKKLESLNIFMIGVGAAGCEYLKNFAMMGISSKNKGTLTLTDNDCIEISNLNRQFLFRKNDVGKFKSEIGAKFAKKMNPDFNCKEYQARIGPENEDLFNDDFWEKQDIIFHAVDNIEGRKYIDERVTEFLLNSVDVGILGASGSCSVYLKKASLCFNDLNLSPNDSQNSNVGLCTIHAFPTSISHCIEWSREQYEKYFVLNMHFLINCVNESESEFFLNIRKEGTSFFQRLKLKEIELYFEVYTQKNYQKAIECGFLVFNQLFNLNIQEVLIQYPPDYKNKDGSKFYSGTKHIPIPVNFKDNEYVQELCIIFISSFANLLFEAFQIPANQNHYKKNDILNIINTIKTDKLEQVEKLKLEEIKVFFTKIKSLVNGKNLKIKEITFNKDNDSNGQYDFIYAGGNLRAYNYQIPKCDKIKSKITAGKIVPSIATSNACITGLASMQIYLMIQFNNFKDKLKNFRNYSINLGTCNFDYSFPSQVIIHNEKNDIPKNWNVWDLIKFKGPMKIIDFIQKIKKDYDVEVEFILSGTFIFYNKNDKENNTKNKVEDKKIENLFQDICKIKIDKKKKILLKIIGKKNNNLVNMPIIKYIFK